MAERKTINMGEESPKISLPEPVTFDESMQEEVTLADEVESLSSAQESEIQYVGDRVVPIIQEECNRFQENNGDDSATVCSTQSDLNSTAFYWNARPSLVAADYSGSLEKSLLKKAPRLLEHIHALRVEDPSVILAVKELLCTDDKVSTILKRMHACGKASVNQQPTTKANVCLDACVDLKFHSNDIQDIVGLSPKTGYLWKGGELYTYDIGPSLEHMRVDFEHAKLGALEQLFEESVRDTDQKYTLLRETFRTLVTGDLYTDPPFVDIPVNDEDDGTLPTQLQPRLPAQWISDNVRSDALSRFNVQSFLKDCKIGQLEKQLAYFDLDTPGNAFIVSLNEMIRPKEMAIRELSRYALFDLKRTDDVLHRFLKYTAEYSLMLNVLSVLLSHHCVLVRLHLNHSYPNLSIYLRLIETMEHDHLYRVISPFFPPRSRNVVDKYLTDLGFLDDSVHKLTHVFTVPKPQEPVIRQRFFSARPKSPSPPPSPPPAPSPPSSPAGKSVFDETQMTFSSLFTGIFKR